MSAPRLVSTWIVAIAAFSISAMMSTGALAAAPPSNVVDDRLESAREAAADLDVSVDIETIGQEESGIDSLAALGKRAATGNDGAFPWKLLLIVLTSSDPWSDLEALAGSFDTSVTDIRTQDEAFVYSYGDNPSIAVSRDLAVIRQVQVERSKTRWNLVASGRLEQTPMPENIVLLRDGRPFLRVQLSLPSGPSE